MYFEKSTLSHPLKMCKLAGIEKSYIVINIDDVDHIHPCSEMDISDNDNKLCWSLLASEFHRGRSQMLCPSLSCCCHCHHECKVTKSSKFPITA